MHSSNPASVERYFSDRERVLGRGGRRPTAHWARLLRLRRHKLVRPDQLGEVWDTWVSVHGGDSAAALGTVVVALLDAGLLEEVRP